MKGQRMLGVVVALILLYASVGVRYRTLLRAEYGWDGLLWAIWIVMTGLVAWRFDARRDLLLITVAALGGFVIEWWGTNTGIWHYFTHDRPPLWIIPAWPVAAVSVDRLTTLFEERWTLSRLHFGYWLMIPAFVVVMTSFLWPTIDVFASQVVVALMVGVVVFRPNPRWDVALFLTGSMMGVFLEYWGTSRQCWTYYTGELPPPEAVFAHGFASVAFQRATTLISAVTPRLRLRPRRPAL